jgi:hypothetical protein
MQPHSARIAKRFSKDWEQSGSSLCTPKGSEQSVRIDSKALANEVAQSPHVEPVETLNDQLDKLGEALRMMDELMTRTRTLSEEAQLEESSIGQVSTEAGSWQQLCSVMISSPMTSLQLSASMLVWSAQSSTDDGPSLMHEAPSLLHDAASLLQPSTDTLDGLSFELQTLAEEPFPNISATNTPWWSVAADESVESPVAATVAATSPKHLAGVAPPQQQPPTGRKQRDRSRMLKFSADSLDNVADPTSLRTFGSRRRERQRTAGTLQSLIAPDPREQDLAALTPRRPRGVGQVLMPLHPAPDPVINVAKACHVRSIEQFLDKTPRGSTKLPKTVTA